LGCCADTATTTTTQELSAYFSGDNVSKRKDP
jgi:hypothetical protein